jgi:hypothetical protein
MFAVLERAIIARGEGVMAEIGLRVSPALASGEWVAPLLGAAIFGAVLLKGSAVIGDPDIQWHIETGRWIAAHASVPDRDIFSFSMPGAPWHAHEWLSELIFWAVFRLSGWSGVVATAASAAGVGFALLAAALARHLHPRHVVIVSMAAFAVASQHILARPHILTWPILVLWTDALCSARERKTVPHPAALLLMVIWANLHGSYVFGVALAGFFAAEAIWHAPCEVRLTVVRGWGLFLCGAALVSLLTPHNPLENIRFAFGFLDGSGFIAPIGEWQPADFGTLSGLELVLLGLLALALLGRIQVPPLRILLLVGLIQLALTHVRHGELLGLVAPLSLAPALARGLYGDSVAATSSGRMPPLVIIGALALFTGSWASRADVAPPAAVSPIAAVNAARQAGLLKEPVFNHFNFGGFLIAAKVPVLIDGRADLYGAAFLSRYLEATSLARPDSLESLLDRYGIRWTLLPPGTPAIALLDHLPGWTRLYADEYAVVHRRVVPGR